MTVKELIAQLSNIEDLEVSYCNIELSVGFTISYRRNETQTTKPANITRLCELPSYYGGHIYIDPNTVTKLEDCEQNGKQYCKVWDKNNCAVVLLTAENVRRALLTKQNENRQEA